jgi:hypothetical protein
LFHSPFGGVDYPWVIWVSGISITGGGGGGAVSFIPTLLNFGFIASDLPDCKFS